MKNKRIIKVEIPKEIWDADMSIWNWNRNLVEAWLNSIKDVVKQMSNEHN